MFSNILLCINNIINLSRARLSVMNSELSQSASQEVTQMFDQRSKQKLPPPELLLRATPTQQSCLFVLLIRFYVFA